MKFISLFIKINNFDKNNKKIIYNKNIVLNDITNNLYEINKLINK